MSLREYLGDIGPQRYQPVSVLEPVDSVNGLQYESLHFKQTPMDSYSFAYSILSVVIYIFILFFLLTIFFIIIFKNRIQFIVN